MNLRDVANTRLHSQQIAATKFKTAEDIVGWMGAMQAQDHVMAKWAIGVRLPGVTNNLIETALATGQIIRTHVLRPTWHFALAKDIEWMIDLTAPRIKQAVKPRYKELEFTPSIIKKSNTIIGKALTGNKHLTREQLAAELNRAKIATDNNRMTHLMLEAEMEKIICSGAVKNKKQTYALFYERVPSAKPLNKDEALAKLAKKYFASHCPATLQDFKWWSGLKSSDAESALEMIKRDLISEKINSQTYWLTNTSFGTQSVVNAFLLPAFDEFIVSYKDRSACLSFHSYKKVISNNGIFWPAIIINGQIKGTWSRMIQDDTVFIKLQFFQPPNKTVKNLVQKESQKLGYFLDRNIDVSYVSN